MRIKNILFAIVVMLVSGGVYGQNDYNFMNLNATSVTCRSGKYYLDGLHQYMNIQNFDYSYFTTIGINPEDHQVISQQGKDLHTGNLLDILPTDGNGNILESSVIKLGNDRVDYGYPGHAQDISYVFDVDPLNSILLLKFAVVFQHASDHDTLNKPFFSVRVSDVNNVTLENCAEYEVSALEDLSGFNSYPEESVMWRDWSTIGIDLSRYVGSKVKVTFTTKACRQGEHFGYAYFTAKCVPNSISASECDANSITLTAPDYFQSYEWFPSGETTQSVTYTLPANGELRVSCHLISFTGCELDLLATVLNNSSYSGGMHYYDEQHCVGTSYELHGFSISADDLNSVGDYTFINTVIGYNNCNNPTNIILTLHVVNQIHVNYEANICQNEGFNGLGWNITNPTPGTQQYTHNDYSYKGCDSITTLTLKTHPSEYTLNQDTVCQGQYYSYHGNSINTQTPGLVTSDYHGYNNYGCDHTYHLDLIVNEVYNYTIYDSICAGETYNDHNFNVSPQGTGTFNYTNNETTVNGCDSIVHLNLTVYPVVEHTINAAICAGENYTENGFSVMNPTVGNHPNIQTLSNLTTVHGCDSIVHLNLVVNDIIVENINATVSYGDDYHDNYFDFIHPAIGVIDSTLILMTQSGCEHIVNLHLVVNETFYVPLHADICYGEEYHGYNFNITQLLPVGTHTFTDDLHTVAMADSTVVLTLDVHPVYQNEVINAQICYGNDYTEYGFNVIQPSEGLYTEDHHLTTIFGCDSIVHLNLQVLSNLESTRYGTVCDGESYQDDLFNIQATGLTPGLHVYNTTIPSTSGCDSIVTLNLMVGESKSVYINDYACQYDVYDTLGFYIELMDPNPHEYRDTLYLSSSIGCDSTVYLNVGTAPVNIVRYNDEMCFGGSYNNWGFTVDNPQPGHHVIRRNVYLFPGLPCPDTIHELTLDVWPLVDSLLYDTICEGDNYFRNGFQIVNPPVGLNKDTLYTQSCHGCDSTVYLELTVNPLLYKTLNIDVCEHDHFNAYGFDIQDVQMNEPQHVLQVPSVVTGCDSTVYLNLNVNDILYTHINASICFGGTYSDNNGFSATPNELGMYRDTLWLTSHSGCDSLVCLALMVNPVYNINVSAFIGEGESYNEGAFNIQTPSIGTYYYDTLLTSIHGCDSTVHLTLSVYETYGINIDTIICYGDNYIDNDFTYIIPQVGDYQNQITYPTVHGVDSTITLNLHVKPVFNDIWARSICFGDDYVEEPFNILNPNVGVNYYDTTLYTVFGCDSIISLVLDVKHTYDTLISTFIGTGYNYEENGFEIIQLDEGYYEFDSLYSSVFGCDSLVRLHLNVYPTKQTYLHDSICDGEDYLSNGFQLEGYQVGTYNEVLNLYTVNNVDSTVYLQLDVNEVYDYMLFDEICLGQNYNNYNFNVLQPSVGIDIEVQNLTTIHGCDSIVTLALDVHPTYSDYHIDSVCYGDIYSGYGFTVNSLDAGVGLYRDTLHLSTTDGCDSIVYLSLYVRPVYDILFEEEICTNEDYTLQGFSYIHPDAGTYFESQSLTSMSGCDSVVSLDLTVHPIFDTVFNMSICHGEDYVDNGFEFLQPEIGTHFDTLFLSSVYGCDSVVAIELHVWPTFSPYIIDSICFDEDYIENGFTEIYPPVGMNYDTLFLQSVHGCDSTVYLHLKVNPIYANYFADSVCEGEEYHLHGFNDSVMPVGLHFDTLYLQTLSGCDSLSYLELTVMPTHETDLVAAICEGDDYTDNGFNILQPQPGDSIYSIVLSNEYGCDSTVNLSLKVWPDSYKYIVDTVCHGVDYLLDGFKIIQAEVGTVYDTLFLTNSHGCDSTVYLDLTVVPDYDTLVIDSICYGEDYTQYGFAYDHPEVGRYIDTLWLTNQYGCDSIIFLDLKVNPVYDTLFTDTICHGLDYTLHGFNIIQPAIGVMQDTLLLNTGSGCDSIIYLDLTVMERSDTLIVAFICEGQDYIANGFEYIQPAAGIYMDSLQVTPIAACDSMVFLHLEVHDAFLTNIMDTICEGESYTENGFVMNEPVAGVYFDTLAFVTDYGCDSLVTLELTVNPVDSIMIMDTVCENGIYTQYGFQIDSLTVGTMYDTLWLTNQYGCDSVVSLQLTVNPTHDTLFMDTICYGMDYTLHGFDLDSLPVGTTYDTINLTNIYGCDSIVYLELTVNPVHDTLFMDTVCENDIYALHGFQLDSLTVGTMYDTLFLQNQFGCDSLIYLQLTVNPIHDTLFMDTVCENGAYAMHGFQLDSLTVGTMYDTLFLQNQYGCDSTVYLQLTVNPIHDTLFMDTICQGMDYTLNGFEYITPAVGQYFDTLNLTNIYGCDSIVYLELTVNPVDTVQIYDTICFGESYTLHGFNLDSLQVGVTYDELDLTNMYGCDSIVLLSLRVGSVDTTMLFEEICFGQVFDTLGFYLDSLALGVTYDTLNLTSMYGCDSTVYLQLTVNPINDTVFMDSICAGTEYTLHGFDVTPMEAGMFYDTLWLTNQFGCDSVVRLELYVDPRYDIVYDVEICQGESYTQHGFEYITPEPGTYYDTLNLTTTIGCDSILMLTLTVHELQDTLISVDICYGESYVGNGFTYINPEVGEYVDELHHSDIHGCDSTVVLNLFVHELYDITIIDTICEGESYDTLGFHIMTPPLGMVYDTLFLYSIYGCDSVVKLELAIEPVLRFDDAAMIDGQSIVYVSTNLQTGRYEYYIDSVANCTRYIWELIPANPRWVLEPSENGLECTVWVTTASTHDLIVRIGNYCGGDTLSTPLYGQFFGVDESETGRVSVYPNPTRGQVTIEGESIERVYVQSTSGQMMRREDFDHSDRVVLELDALPRGTYLIIVESEKGRTYKHIVIDK